MPKALIPQYLKEFVCDGQRCPDNCCEGVWNIWVDEPHFKKIKRVKDPEWAPLIQKHVKRNRKSQSRDAYGKIVHDPEMKKCVFLSEDKLCNLQMTFGPDMLCDVCMLYPRITNRIDQKHIERSLTLSCPLAADLILNSPEGLAFEEVDLELHGREHWNRTLILSSPKMKRKEQKHFFDLRDFSVQILKSRALNLWERIVVLGFFFRKVQELVDNDQADGIPFLIESFTERLIEGAFDEGLKDIPTLTMIQMKLTKELGDYRVFAGVTGRFLAVFKEYLEGIHFELDVPDEDNAERYQKAVDQWYRPFMADKEYILENYLVNYVFSKLFPFTGEATVFESYAMLVVHYAFVKMLLIGGAAYHKDAFSPVHVVRVVQQFAKAVEHNRECVQTMYNALKHNGYMTMPYMAILVKN